MELFGSKKNMDGPDNDLLIIGKYQESGKTSVLSNLFVKYNPLIFGVCMKYLKDIELSKDLSMEIYEKLITELRTQKIENFKSWLYVLVKNQCLMFLRKEKRRLNELEELEKNPIGIMENHLDWHPFNTDQEGILRMMLNQCLKKLAKDQKDSIVMFYLDRRSYQEISELMNIEMKSVKSHIQNGRRNLKICLDNKVEKMKSE